MDKIIQNVLITLESAYQRTAKLKDKNLLDEEKEKEKKKKKKKKKRSKNSQQQTCQWPDEEWPVLCHHTFW